MEPVIVLLSAADLLNAWEKGQERAPVAKAMLLIATAFPEEPLEALAKLPIGQRDRQLLRLRRHLFGPRLKSLVVCPQCSERLELDFDVDSIQVPEPEGNLGVWDLEIDGYQMRFRLPNSLDLLAAQQAGGRITLLERCLIEAYHDEQPQDVDRLPENVQQALIYRLAELDPQADVRFPISCPVCAHRWMGVLDIATFLWQELQNWAIHLLDEVNILASVYAWREADILALSPWRRRYYVKMVTG
jgi:hypothetical protein